MSTNTMSAVIENRRKANSVQGSSIRHRRSEDGYQDRLRGLTPQSHDPGYFSGYCEAVCNEIDSEARIARRDDRHNWWGLAD